MSETLGNIKDVVGIAGGVQSLFGGGGGITQGAKAKPFRGLITTPGFRFGEGTLVRRPGTENLIGQTRRIGEILEERRGEIRPGFGRLTAARVQAVQNRRGQAIGNLRESLSRRNILGASFAQDAITRTELEFAQEEEKVRAESFLEELQLEQQNLKQQFEIIGTQLDQEFRELQTSAQFLANVDQKKLKDLANTANVERSLQLLDLRDAVPFLDGEQLELIQNLRSLLSNAGFGDSQNGHHGGEGTESAPQTAAFASFADAPLLGQIGFALATLFTAIGPAALSIPGAAAALVELTRGDPFDSRFESEDFDEVRDALEAAGFRDVGSLTREDLEREFGDRLAGGDIGDDGGGFGGSAGEGGFGDPSDFGDGGGTPF